METTKTSSRAYAIEFVMFFTYAFFGINWIAGSTLTPQIMKYFNLKSFVSATFISNAITIAKIIGNFMAAMLLNKLFPKKAIGLASGLIVFGSIIAILSPQYWMFVLGRFIMGFGGALYVVYFSPIVIHYFSKEKRATVNGLNGVAYNVGAVIAMIIVGPVILWLKTWQSSMTFFAVISGILFILWLIFGQDFDINTNANTKNVVSEKYTSGDALKDKFNWTYALTYSGLLTFYIVLLTIFPVSGASAINAKLLSALVGVGGIVGTYIGVLVARKYPLRLPIIRWCGLAMTLCGFIMIFAKNGTIASIAAFGIGFLMFMPVIPLVSIPQELPNMTPKKLTTIMGMFWALSYVFETIFYFILGTVVDHSGYFTAVFISVIISGSFFLGSFFLPETGKKVKEDKTASV